MGRTLARALGQVGTHAAAHYARNRDMTQAVVEDIEAPGCRAIVVSGDVADRETINVTDAHINELLGPIDILVSDAISFLEEIFIWKTPNAQWDRVSDVNIKGPSIIY